MIISPPFLPKSAGHEMDSAATGDAVPPEHNVCEAGMRQCAPGNGAYPVSFSLGWHGGAHLMTPRDARGKAERVRAIADGVVVFVRKTDDTEKAALSYRGVRTDDGCVVLKHTTEIGEGENAKVTYFSIYMHLQTVVGALAVGKKVYRKDVLGVAGAIYGQLGQMHFEIVCDEANLKKLVGRTSTTLSASAGRTDAIYGDMWFKVPAGAMLFAQEPHPYRRDDSESVPGPALSPQAPLVAGGTRCELLMRMRYERGDCVLTTFREQDGRYIEVGQQREPEQEYNLYKRSTTLSAKYVELNQALRANYAAVPSASAIYEMLRFGRIVGPDKLPANAKFGHWRRIVTPEATGWLNLNGPEIGVYSDADFPHWAGWSLISDDVTPDSLCDSPTINRWLDLNGDGHVTHAEAKEALHNAVVQERLSRAICKFPTEWSKDDNLIETRMAWLKRPSDAWPTPLSDAEFSALKAHIQALSFWEDIHDAELPPAERCWRFPPKAFVEHFRKCEWLSLDEIAQLLPRRYGSNRAYATLNWDVARERLNGGTIRYSDLCKTFRKYRFSTAERQIAFLSQTYIETGLLRKVIEDGEGRVASGNAPYYTAFHGRGLMQLTWPSLYSDYGKFRGFPDNTSGRYRDLRINSTSLHHWSGPPTVDVSKRLREDKRRWAPRFDPDIVASDSLNACDSAGFFWVWKHFMGVTNILRLADEGIAAETVGRISVLVNGGGNGYEDRLQYAAFLLRYRGDSTEVSSDGTLTYRRQIIVSRPHQRPVWESGRQSFQIYVDYTPQRNQKY